MFFYRHFCHILFTEFFSIFRESDTVIQMDQSKDSNLFSGAIFVTPTDPPLSIEYDGNAHPKKRRTSIVNNSGFLGSGPHDNRVVEQPRHGRTCERLISIRGSLPKDAQDEADPTELHKTRRKKGCARGCAGVYVKTTTGSTKSELDDLEKNGFPVPLTEGKLKDISKKIHEELNEENVVCCVCDEICRVSQTRLLNVPDLPSSFFTLLRKPSGLDGDAPVIHDELVKQYDVTFAFPGDVRFISILLSPRGVKLSNCSCRVTKDVCCFSRLYVCHVAGCLQALRRGKIPKFAIAQGNWVGQLPEQLRDITYGSRCLIRPVHSFGRLASFYNGGGMRLTGHVYSNKLNTPFVRKLLPIKPSEVPVRVLVVSPLSSNASAAARARIASIKADYVIQPEKISGIRHYFKKIGNTVMEPFEFDELCLRELPTCEVSEDMFHTDNIEPLGEIEKDREDGEKSTDNNDDDTGGPCLSRTFAEVEEAVMISSTVTVGAPEESDKNVHEDVVRVLNDAVSETNKGASAKIFEFYT